jgi:hypothetical protein
MCVSTEIDVRESASDCTLASGEGLDSGGETSHPMSLCKADSSSRERTVYAAGQKTGLTFMTKPVAGDLF